MKYQVTHLAYVPDAHSIGLPVEEFPNGVGLVLIAAGPIKATRAGTPEAVMKLELAGFKTAEAALAAFPRIAVGHPHDWGKAPDWKRRGKL